MKFQELAVDEHNIATHYIDRTGLEVWCENEYHEDGRIKDVHITKMKFPKNWRSSWFNKTYEKDTYFEFVKAANKQIYSKEIITE